MAAGIADHVWTVRVLVAMSIVIAVALIGVGVWRFSEREGQLQFGVIHGRPEAVFDAHGHEVYRSDGARTEAVETVVLSLPPGMYSVVSEVGACPPGEEVIVTAGRTTDFIFVPVTGEAPGRCFPTS
jgi:hypothetical protein